MRSVPRSTKRFSSLLAAGVVASVLAACGAPGSGGADDGEQTNTVRVATAVDQYYGYIALQAHERLGTFEGTDLDVEVISATTPTIGQIMAAGQADIAMAGAGAIVAHGEAGIPMDLTASILTPWDYYVLVSEKSEYAGAGSLEELKGANFGITGEGSPGNYLLNQHADKMGWSSDDFKETALGEVGALFAALSSGQVDAVLWAPDQAYITEAEGVATHFPIPTLTPNVLQAFGTNTDFQASNPDTVKTFLEAYYAEVKDLQANPQDFIDVLVEEWDVDPEIAQRLAENQLPLLSTDGSISDAELKGVAESVPFLSGKPDEPAPSIDYTSWQEIGS